MCDYCKPCGTAIDEIDDYPVFEDMFDCYPVECCEVMCYTANHEVYLVRHAVDWYLALVNGYDGTGSTVSVSACPICGRDLGSDVE